MASATIAQPYLRQSGNEILLCALRKTSGGQNVNFFAGVNLNYFPSGDGVARSAFEMVTLSRTRYSQLLRQIASIDLNDQKSVRREVCGTFALGEWIGDPTARSIVNPSRQGFSPCPR